MSWLSGWGRRKSHTIEGSTAGAQTNYQMKIVVYKGIGTDSGEKVYLGTNVRDDFGDVRFTKSDGITPLDYWMESYTLGTKAIFWVEVDTIPASPDTVDIYIYYDKPDAITTSNIYNTFLLGDSFEDGLVNWTIVEGDTTTNTTDSTVVFKGNYSYKGEETTIFAVSAIEQAFPQQAKVVVYGAFRVPSSAARTTGLLRLNGTLRFRWQNQGGNLVYYTGATWITVYSGAINTWYQYKVVYKNTSVDLYFYDANGTLLGSATGITAFDSTGDVNTLGLNVWYSTGTGAAWQDFIRIRKYADPEPSHGAWGSEETAPKPIPEHPLISRSLVSHIIVAKPIIR